MPPDAREAIRIVRYYGWKRLRKTRGSHLQFKHDQKRGKVSNLGPLGKAPDIETWKSIARQADLPRRIIREYPTWKLWR